MRIKLIYTKPKNHPFPLISYAIRFFTNWGASHVIMVFEEDDKGFHIYFNNWVLQPLDEILEKHTVFVTQNIVVDEEMYESLLKEATTDNGIVTKGYNAYLFGALLGKIFRTKNPAMLINSITATTCSESLYSRLFYRLKTVQVYRVLMNGLPQWKVSNISPKSLFEVFAPISFSEKDYQDAIKYMSRK